MRLIMTGTGTSHPCLRRAGPARSSKWRASGCSSRARSPSPKTGCRSNG